MTPEEIQGDYQCTIAVADYRVGKKAEFKVIVHLSFYSSRTHSMGSTSWHIWRSFSAFRKLDEQLRKRNATHLKGIKFPPLYRRRVLFRTHLSADFLETRMRELDTYMNMVVLSPQAVAFHVLSVASQTLKSFVSFANGFGQNAQYQEQDAKLRPSVSVLASPAAIAMSTTASVMADDEDEFRSVSSSSTISSMTSSYSAPGDYRWSGTGFRGSQSFQRHTVPMPNGGSNMSMYQDRMSSFSNASNGHSSSFGGTTNRGSWFPVSAGTGGTTTTEGASGTTISRPSMVRPSFSGGMHNGRDSMMSMTAPDTIAPELDMQRAKMETELVKFDLVGVGMPPDGSCLLHCVVYEMYPLQCLREYPSSMSVVNVGAADGMAPRRMAAAQFLRMKLMEYALTHVESLASFLMQDPEDLRERYECFRDTPDEQATIAELYAAASMFNIEIVLISNDESFQIDPVLPVAGLPSIREGGLKTVTFGYLIPAEGVAGHYICTRERRAGQANAFVGGSYRGSISIGPPKNVRCSTAGPRMSVGGPRPFQRIQETRVE